MRVLVLFLFFLMAPLGAAAQTVANSFQQLEGRQLLKEGDTILISYSQVRGDDDTTARGTLVSLTGTSITVRFDSGEELEIAESDVRRITGERKDTVWKGAFIGAGVGLGYGAVTSILICSSGWDCEAGGTAGYLLVLSGIGFAVGAGIDAAHGKPQMEVVYLESPPVTGSVTVSVFPILSRKTKGVRVTVTW